MLGRVLSSLLLCALFASQCTEGFKVRRILFAKCEDVSDQTAKPLAVFMTCANPRGDCEVRLGNNHTLQAVFKPKMNSTDLSSWVRWNNIFQLSLPGQDNNGCNSVQCPLVVDRVTRFTYTLYIDPFFPPGEYPIIWSLNDEETNTYATCWKFKINIV